MSNREKADPRTNPTPLGRPINSTTSTIFQTMDRPERELAASKKLGIGLVATHEPDYPPRLAMIDDAPPLLGIRGATGVLQRPMIGIVGLSKIA